MAQLITLETAKLFDETEKYIKVGDNLENHTLEYEYYYCPEGGYGDELLDHDYALSSRIDRHGWKTYPAYPQEQLKKYLRDTYRIIVECFYTHDYDNPKFNYRVNIINGNERKMIEQTEEFDQTYEEALELGLIEGIKHIK